MAGASFQGALDEFRLYKTALSTDDVRGLMWFLQGANSVLLPRGVFFDSLLLKQMTNASAEDVMNGPLAGATIHGNDNKGSVSLNARVIQMVIDLSASRDVENPTTWAVPGRTLQIPRRSTELRGKAMDTSKILVKDLMSPAPRTVNTGETVSAVISKMRKERIKELPVLDAGRPVGLVSYTSLIARRSVPLTAKVESIMMPCAKLEETAKLTEAAEALISVGARGAPVVRDGKVVGFLSRTDIVRAMVEFTHLGKGKVGEFMTADPVSVTESDIVRKAQIIMEELDEKALPVVDRTGDLVGVVGMSEVIDVIWSPKAQRPPGTGKSRRGGPGRPAGMYAESARTETQVGSVMNRSPVHVSPDDTLEKLVSLMLTKGLSTIFVTAEGKLVGVVDQVDLMEIVAGLEPKKGVYVRISGLDIQEPDAYETLYGLIERTMKGINRYESPRVFSAHVRTYKEGGWTNKYSVGARLTTERGTYFASDSGWNLYKAMDSVLDLFEGMVKRKGGRRIADVKAEKRSYRDED